VTFLFAALALVVRRRKVSSRWVQYATVGGFLLVALLTGSAPGGAARRADFDTAKVAVVNS
jgi:hypothetical protein